MLQKAHGERKQRQQEKAAHQERHAAASAIGKAHRRRKDVQADAAPPARAPPHAHEPSVAAPAHAAPDEHPPHMHAAATVLQKAHGSRKERQKEG